jgi:hypothetical protein
MKKANGSFHVFIIIVVLMLLTVGYSLTFSYYEAKFLPLLIRNAIFILAAVGLINEIVNKMSIKSSRLKLKSLKRLHSALKGEIICTPERGYSGFFLAIYLLAFLIAYPLLAIFYLELHNTGWIITTLYVGLTSILTYSIFDLRLKIILNRGVVFSYF